MVIEIPAGSLLFLSAIMHAGYGIWAIDNALVNFVPSMDDLRRTKVEELLKRYQAHASRPLVLQEKGNKSIDPTVTERAGVNPAAASHVHFDRTKPLILLYPPVFCVGGQRVDLEYDATQFADVGDVLTAEQMVEKYGTLDPTETTNTNEKQGAEEAM